MNTKYQNHFSRGFYISSSKVDDVAPELEDWKVLEVGGFTFGFQEKCKFSIAESEVAGKKVFHVFIGFPTDIINHSFFPDEIGDIAVQKYVDEGFKEYEKYIAYLGGRFISFLVDARASSILVHPDCHSTYSCYYSLKDAGVLFASHVNLVHEMLGKEIDETAMSIMKNKDYKSPGGKYFPGLLTPYRDTIPIFPNCRVEFSKPVNRLTVKRFYPFMENGKVVENSNKSSDFARLLESNLKSIVKADKFFISLTAGLDSRATLNAALKVCEHDAIRCFTYFKGERSSVEQIKDLSFASAISFEESIPHKAVLIKEIDYSSKFHKFYAKTFKRCARFPSLARAYYEELPHDILSLISLGSETGMAFYKDRSEKTVTPRLLAKLYTPSPVNKEEMVLNVFKDYIEKTEFYCERLGWLDPYDAFYWEHRNAKWASLWYSEADLSHFTVVPFNQRDLIEAMLAAPLEERKEKKLILDYISSV